MLQVWEQGIHRNCSISDYYADPAPQPSLTQTLAKLITSSSPLHAWHAHPRLNAHYQPENPVKYDVPNLAHAMLLGRGREITIIEADNWRTKVAQEKRDAVLAAGGLPALPKHMERASAMVNVCKAHLADIGVTFDRTGDSEVALVWSEQVRDGHKSRTVWFRSLIDKLMPDSVWDYKTTEGSASPENCERNMIAFGWDIQAAMHERGLRILAPSSVRQAPAFLVQETYPPYAVCIARLMESAVGMGAAKLQMAAERWAHCMRRNLWPGYGGGAEVMLGYPDYALVQFERAEAVRALQMAEERMAGNE